MQVICLANSYKHQGRCIAGIAVDSREWVRPVSGLEDGRIPMDDPLIPWEQMTPLDIVDIPLTDARGPGYERENRRYTNQKWNILGKAEVVEILPYREPQLLYPEFGSKIPATYLNKMESPQTLQLIEAKQVRWEQNAYGRWKAFLDDFGTTGLSVTDPVIRRKLDQGQPVSSHCLLCMSFGQAWQGEIDPEPMHYRLVAGVIELLPEIEMIAQEMRRVGWSIDQGRDYLKRHFAKESRYQLTAAEAQAFVHFLQTLPAAC